MAAIPCRPIPMSVPMIRPSMDDTKTQTRRLINPQPTLCRQTGFNWKGRAYGLGLSEGGTERNFAIMVWVVNFTRIDSAKAAA